MNLKFSGKTKLIMSPSQNIIATAKDYDWETIVRKYVEVYQSVLKQRDKNTG